MKRLYYITHNYFICRLVIIRCQIIVMRKQSDVFHDLYITVSFEWATWYQQTLRTYDLSSIPSMTATIDDTSGENYLHQLVLTMMITMHVEWWMVVNSIIPVTSALSMIDTHQLDILHSLPCSINIHTTYIPVVQPMLTIYINYKDVRHGVLTFDFAKKAHLHPTDWCTEAINIIYIYIDYLDLTGSLL